MDKLSNIIYDALEAVLNIFPDSPFVYMESIDSDWLGYLNWFVPVNTFVSILEGWLICVGMYYLWQVILRWIKVIE